MNNCPVCSTPLTQVAYEGFIVQRCEQCKGHLLTSSRLDAIKRITRKSQEELKAEAAEFHGEHTGRIKCPGCYAPMDKQAIRVPVLTLQMDVCRRCSLVWFDGGELAIAQLGYEATPGFADAQEMKRRMAELEASPARKAAFEKNLAKLPEPTGVVEQALEDFAERGIIAINPYGLQVFKYWAPA